MFKNQSLAIMLTIFAASCSSVASAEAYLECNDCSQTQINQKALTWVFTNISESEAKNNIEKIVHVIDTSKTEVQSFQVRRKAILGPLMGNPSIPRKIFYVADSDRIDPPQDIIEKLNDIKLAKRNLKSDAQSLVIPESVISDPWEFVSCGYCKNSVQNYFNNSLSGQIASVDTAIREFAEAFGVLGGSLSELYRLDLAAGGYVKFKATLLNNSSELDIEIKEVFDESGNSVPLTESQAKNLAIYVPDVGRASDIAYYLHTIGMGIELTKGRVTIRECTGEMHDDCFD